MKTHGGPGWLVLPFALDSGREEAASGAPPVAVGRDAMRLDDRRWGLTGEVAPRNPLAVRQGRNWHPPRYLVNACLSLSYALRLFFLTVFCKTATRWEVVRMTREMEQPIAPRANDVRAYSLLTRGHHVIYGPSCFPYAVLHQPEPFLNSWVTYERPLNAVMEGQRHGSLRGRQPPLQDVEKKVKNKPMRSNTCPDEEGIKTPVGGVVQRGGRSNTCPDEEGIKTFGPGKS